MANIGSITPMKIRTVFFHLFLFLRIKWYLWYWLYPRSNRFPCPPYNNTRHQVGATPLSSLFATVLPDHHQVHKRGGLDHHLDHLDHLGHHLDHYFDHCKVHKRGSLPLDHDCCALDVDEVNPNLTGGRFQLPGRCSEKTRLHFSHSRCSSLSVSRTTWIQLDQHICYFCCKYQPSLSFNILSGIVKNCAFSQSNLFKTTIFIWKYLSWYFWS